MTLADMPNGTACTVERVTGEHRLSLRLMELGFTPGTEVMLVKTAPSGDPLMLRLRGYTLTISRRDASSIHVRR
ncbi:MAG: ferrous iron transport protein A [Clostridia bacterium]|nr:ferrous iron transport protein A [Clostridia bacterium]